MGKEYRVEEDLLIDWERSILDGGVRSWWSNDIKNFTQILKRAARYYHFPFREDEAIGKLSPPAQAYLFMVARIRRSPNTFRIGNRRNPP